MRRSRVIRVGLAYDRPAPIAYIPEGRMKWLLIAGLSVSLTSSTYAQLAAPNAAGISMGHVHLNVKDVEVQKRLWTEHFGAVPLKREGLNGVKLPGVLILFTQRESSGGSEGTVMDHVGLKVRNLAGALQRWREAGYLVQREFKGTEGFPNAYLIGPDEVKIELQEDTALPVQAIGYHLHYILGDYVKLRDWYADTFSLVSGKRGEHDAADVPGMNLTFTGSRKPPTLGTRGRAVDHVGFEVRDLEAFCKKLEARGIKFDVPYRKVPERGLAIAFLTDPNGVYIELTEGLDGY
jgi:catechol 2,3-dioxygenase-like lactoylglutathione lyase family enzyme